MPITTFPTTIDTFNNPGQGNTLADAGVEHDLQHDKANDALFALETKVGIGGSPVTSSLDYLMAHHSHSGVDGSASLSISSVRPASDGQVLNLQTAGGASVVSVSSTTAGPTESITPPGAGTVALVLKGAASQTADFVQYQSSAAVVQGGVTSTGMRYSYGGLTLYKGVGGLLFVGTVPASGYLDLANGAVLRGFSGAPGTGQVFNLDNSSGKTDIGGPSAGSTLRLNAYKVNRMAILQIDGKNNANSGGMNWQDIVDADGQVYAPRTKTLLANLQKTADGSAGPAEQFATFGFPTYDGVSTDTKAIGLSVQSGVTPVLTAGTVDIRGNLNVTGTVAQTGESVATDFKPTGLTGAVAASRYGGATASGAPTTGTWAVGDYIVDQTGQLWECRVAGTPGTWTLVSPTKLYKARAWRAAGAQSLLNNTQTTLTYDTLDYDPNSNLVIATGIYTCPVAGYYLVTGGVGSSIASGVISINIVKNAAAIKAAQVPSSVSGVVISVFDCFHCAAGDTISLQALQNSGGTASLLAAAAWQNFSVHLQAMD